LIEVSFYPIKTHQELGMGFKELVPFLKWRDRFIKTTSLFLLDGHTKDISKRIVVWTIHFEWSRGAGDENKPHLARLQNNI
jgi:hypothetical protein